MPKKVRLLEILHDFHFITPGNSTLFLFLTSGYSTCLEIQYSQPSLFGFFLEQPILILPSYNCTPKLPMQIKARFSKQKNQKFCCNIVHQLQTKL